MTNITKAASTPQVDVSRFSDEQKDLEGINLFCHFQINILKAFQYISLYFERVDYSILAPRPKDKERLLEYHLNLFEDLDVKILREKSKALSDDTHVRKEELLKGLRTSVLMKEEVQKLKEEYGKCSREMRCLEDRKELSREPKTQTNLQAQIEMKNTEKKEIVKAREVFKAKLKELVLNIKISWDSLEFTQKQEKGLRKLAPYLKQVEAVRQLILEYKDTFHLFSKVYGTSGLFKVSHVSSSMLEHKLETISSHVQAIRTMCENDFSLEDIQERVSRCFDTCFKPLKGVNVNYIRGLQLFLPSLMESANLLNIQPSTSEGSENE